MSRPGKSDILISIKPVHMTNIASRAKTHEFRKYLIPASVQRMWFYTTSPVQSVQHIAVVSKGKEAVEAVSENVDLGNEDFNAVRKELKYGYEILHLYELRESLTLGELMEKGFAKGAPRKYQWVCKEMLDSVRLEDQILSF
jgi:predicted transcriptional regulator